MENLTDSKWNFYKSRLPDHLGPNWIIETQIELLSRNEFGHFGLVWGFDQSREYVNRFTLSADGIRGLVMHFQKDHQRVFHRFQKEYSEAQTDGYVDFGLLKIDTYYYFLLNKQLMYVCEQSHFANQGNYFGYYLEPGLQIRSSYMTVNRLKIEEPHRENFECLFF